MGVKTNQEGELSFGSDHVSITIELAVDVDKTPAAPRYNWTKVKWPEFNTKLSEIVSEREFPFTRYH